MHKIERNHCSNKKDFPYICSVSDFKSIYQKALSSAKSESGLPESINDLRIKDLNGEVLSTDQITALTNYELFKKNLLESVSEEDKFQECVKKLSVISNFTSWKDFV